jgi:hypothetical protein
VTAEQLANECRRLWARRIKPTLPEVRPLIDAYYALPGNGAGGELHVVLDDGNYERRFIRGVIAHAERVETRWLAHLLCLLSNSQRRRM